MALIAKLFLIKGSKKESCRRKEGIEGRPSFIDVIGGG